MISYEDARRFRENVNAPLTWDEDIPPPPRDRIEFTRLILEAAEETVLDLPQWELPLNNDESEKKFRKFQKTVYRHTHRRSSYGVPKVNFSIWNENGHAACSRTLKWGEYIEEIESDYHEPWKTSWTFGILEGSEERVFALIEQSVVELNKRNENGAPDPDIFKYPNAKEISGLEIISDYLDLRDGRQLSLAIARVTTAELSLVEERVLGFKGNWTLFVEPVVGLMFILVSIVGAIKGVYSGWFLLLIIPTLFVVTIIVACKVMDFNKKCWNNKKLTFRQFAQQIVAMKKREWETLQRTYAVR